MRQGQAFHPVAQVKRDFTGYLDSARHDALVKGRSDRPGFFQRLVSAVLVDCLEAARRNTNAHKLLQLRHPNALATQIRRENARHHFCNVSAYAAFFLSQTAPVNNAAARCSGSCDVANFHVSKKRSKLPRLAARVKRMLQGMTAPRPPNFKSMAAQAVVP